MGEIQSSVPLAAPHQLLNHHFLRCGRGRESLSRDGCCYSHSTGTTEHTFTQNKINAETHITNITLHYRTLLTLPYITNNINITYNTLHYHTLPYITNNINTLHYHYYQHYPTLPIILLLALLSVHIIIIRFYTEFYSPHRSHCRLGTLSLPSGGSPSRMNQITLN